MSDQSQAGPPPRWATAWLFAAGVYNLFWGAVVIAFPNLLFDLTATPRPNYPEIWQCVGMIVGVYGIGYLIAAHDPRVHWPIVLVGLLGKVFGPIGFAVAVARGVFPAAFGVTILTNDLIWWVPFALMLWSAWKYHKARPPQPWEVRQFVHESVIDRPPAEVFAFHERPVALESLIPPWEPMRVAESAGSLRPGSRVVLQGRVFGLPVRWVAEHTEYDPPHLFADRQMSGPFAHWHHRHRFTPTETGGTRLRDEVEYVLPGGYLGRWLGGWLVERKLRRIFVYRHDTTRRQVEADGGGLPEAAGRRSIT